MGSGCVSVAQHLGSPSLGAPAQLSDHLIAAKALACRNEAGQPSLAAGVEPTQETPRLQFASDRGLDERRQTLAVAQEEPLRHTRWSLLRAALVAGIGLGLALLTKINAVLLLPYWLLWLLSSSASRSGLSPQLLARSAVVSTNERRL